MTVQQTPDDMVIQCLPTLRASCAKVAAITGHDVDDLIGSALADYVLPQARRYDASRGVSLRSWVSSLARRGGMYASRKLAPAGLRWCAQVATNPHVAPPDVLARSRRKLNAYRYGPRLDAPIGDSGSSWTLHSVLSDADDDPDRDIDMARVRAALLAPPAVSSNPQRDALIVRHRMDGELLRVIGDRYGISGEMVRQILRRAARNVRKQFGITGAGRVSL